MKIKFKPLNLLFNIFVLAFLFSLASVNVLYAVPAGIVTGAVLSCVSLKSLSLTMAVQREIWTKDIQEGLYKDNPFLKTFTPADPDNISGRTVHIPQSGGGSSVTKNRASFPATAKRRTDDISSYTIAEHTTDPIHIPDAETIELSYDKRASVIQEDRATLSEAVAEDMLVNVVKSPASTTTQIPSASILVTAGEDVQATAPSATGNRKSYKIIDLQRAANFFRRQKSWTEGRMFALLTPEAAAQMFPADSQITATYMASVSEQERRSGIVYKAYGFNIMLRSSVYVLDTAGAFKSISAAGAATDDEACLFYNGNCIEFAEGDIKMFGNEGDATYYGDVYSFLVRSGGRAKREKYEGILLIKQAKGT